MSRAELQQFAEDRILDAQALLAAQRWSGAYYLAGYAVECGLKSCVLAHVERTGVIFVDRKFAEKCWTHDFEDLVKLAELIGVLGLAIAANPILEDNWKTVTKWDEVSRYQQKTQLQAQKLFDAVNDPTNGVLQWIRVHW